MPTLRDAARLSAEPEAGGPNIPRIVNLTGHAVTLLAGRSERTCDPSGMIARIDYESRILPPVEMLDNDGEHMLMPRRRIRRRKMVNLPDQAPGVLYIVSRIVASYAGGRDDILVPDGVQRDSRGEVYGCLFLTEVDDG